MVWSPEPPCAKDVQVLGKLEGSVRLPAHCGSTASVSTRVSSASFPEFVTLILNTAFSPRFTFWLSFHILPSRSFVFASLLSITTAGPGAPQTVIFAGS